MQRLIATGIVSMVLTLPASGTEKQDCVVVLHGLARSASSMNTMADALKEAGYQVTNVDYPSTKANIQTLAPLAIEPALRACNEAPRVHFVTHSLGGILVRQFFAEQLPANRGRVLMLGPPNKGSELVDQLEKVPGFSWVNGPAGYQLGTGDASVPRQLGPANFELGVIAGSSSLNPLYSSLLPGDDDGKVSVESTRLEGMSAHLVLPVTHTFMMNNSTVIDNTLSFLAHGEFDLAN